MPTIYILIGPPGAGKSTWRAAFSEPAVVISSDDKIDEYAKQHGLTYSEAWSKVDMKEIDRQWKAEFAGAVERRENIVVDRTNMSRKSRSRFLNLPSEYRTVAVDFKISRDVLDARLEKRAQETGKHISKVIVDSMLRNYEAPTREEFDQVITV